MYCHCGCGTPAPIAKLTNAKRGNIKGQPQKYILGHRSNLFLWSGPDNPRWNGGSSKLSTGYVVMLSRNHPRANSRGYVREHILIAEKAIGRLLPSDAQVHHVNGDRSDNRCRNLVVCESHAYHAHLHSRERAYKACGHADYLKCWYCGQYDLPSNLLIYRGQRPVHRDCKRISQAEYYMSTHE